MRKTRMPTTTRPAAALGFALVAAASLAGCGGGGGGSSTTTTVTTPPINIANLGLPDAVVSAPQGSSLRGNSPLIASGSTPNLTTSPPPNGTVFPLNDAIVKVSLGSGQTATTVGGYTNSLTGGTTLTLQGTQVVNDVTQNIYQLKEPGLSLDASNLVSSTTTGLPDGRFVTVETASLNYTLMGFWSLSRTASPDNVYWGMGVSGYQTPSSGIPASGTATYVGGSGTNPASGLVSKAGGVFGEVFASYGSTVAYGDLRGQASLNVNFSTATIAGSLTNMTVSVLDGAPNPWNSVALSGNLSGAVVQGTTTVTTVPPNVPYPAAVLNTLLLGAGATGTFTGTFFGPNAQELGINWNLYDPSGNGKAAFGSLSAIVQ